MSKRKIQLFIEITKDRDFHKALENNANVLICAEIYCGFVGPCTVLDLLFKRAKTEWSNDDLVLLRVLADDIEVLSRLRGHSEPFFMFIVNKEVTHILRGVDSLKMEAMMKKELNLYRMEQQGALYDRPKYRLDEPTPEEMAWITELELEQKQVTTAIAERHAARQAVRKRHRAELMTAHLGNVNFVLYWPHAKDAHIKLYERWDQNNLMMIAREELQLSEETAKDVLYAGDAPVNEASMQALLNGPALAICLRSLESDVDTVALVRRILYEDLYEPEEDKKAFPGSAYDFYKTRSLSREQIWKRRRQEKEKKLEERREKRARLLSEIQRITREAIVEAIEAKKLAKEQKRMELLKTSKLQELELLNAEPDDFEDVDIDIPEALPESEEEEEEEELVEDPDEYFPPSGLLIPGLYSPSNDIAKANGLAVLFPTIVEERVKPQEEFLPPHVLVMLNVQKRHKVIEHMEEFADGILHMGIYKGTTPYDAVFETYSVKQFNKLDYEDNLEDFKLCFMVSIKMDRTLLELMDFYPVHVSRDAITGEDECAMLFPPTYGDDYDEFEDFGPMPNEIEINLSG